MPRRTLDNGSTRAWRARRARWQQHLDEQGTLPCARNCGQPILPGQRWHLDHYLDDGNDEHTAPAHEKCNVVAGAELGGRRLGALARIGRQTLANSGVGEDLVDGDFLGTGTRYPVPLSDALPLGDGLAGLTREVAQEVPWLADLAGSDGEWSWPRLSTAIHPRATGSHGIEAIEAIEDAAGRSLWPWQRLVLARVLEHDEDGHLVWRSVGLSVPRQMGKSTVVGELASWRLQSGHRFGGQQSILLVARDVGAAVTVQKPHRLRAEADRTRFKPSAAGGRLAIEYLPDGSEWLIRSSEGVYSYSAVMAVADEAWDLAPSVVDDGLAPVILQQSDAQLWVVSTSNPKATALMLGRRAAAIAELDQPGSTLWLEWSCRPGDDPGDPTVWQASCPHWTDDVAQRYEDLYASALTRRPTDPLADDPVDGFACQYLNRWPASVEPAPRVKGEPYIDVEAWKAAEEDLVPQDPLVIAIEEHQGRAACAVCVGRVPDGRYYIEGGVHDRRAGAIEWARKLRGLYPNSRVLIGANIVDATAQDLNPEKAGSEETRQGLALLREMLAAGEVAHCWSSALTDQLAEARVTVGSRGLALVPGLRSDLLRATLWALVSLEKNPPAVPMIHVGNARQ